MVVETIYYALPIDDVMAFEAENDCSSKIFRKY